MTRLLYALIVLFVGGGVLIASILAGTGESALAMEVVRGGGAACGSMIAALMLGTALKYMVENG